MFVIDEEKLTQRPEMRLGNYVYKIDNRLSVFERMNRRIKDGDGSEFEVIIGGALGDATYKEILEMDLPFSVMQDIVIVILAAIQGIGEDEARARFRQGG